MCRNVFFFHWFLGPLHHWREAKTPYLLGLRVLASSRWALLRRNRTLLSYRTKWRCYFRYGLGQPWTHLRQPVLGTFFLGNIPLALQEGAPHPPGLIMRRFSVASRSQHQLVIGIAAKRGWLQAGMPKLGTHSMKKNRGPLWWQGAAVSWSMKGTRYQSFSIVHSQVTLHGSKAVCKRNVTGGEPGERNKISGDCAKWGVLNFLFAKWIPKSLLSKGSIQHNSALISLGISWVYPARMPLESDLV